MIEIGQPRPVDRPIADDHRAIEQPARDGAGDPPGNRADRAEHGSAGRGTRG
jgi:hypothetical protein